MRHDRRPSTVTRHPPRPSAVHPAVACGLVGGEGVGVSHHSNPRFAGLKAALCAGLVRVEALRSDVTPVNSPVVASAAAGSFWGRAA